LKRFILLPPEELFAKFISYIYGHAIGRLSKEEEKLLKAAKCPKPNLKYL